MFAGIALVSLLTASISSIYVAKRIREDKGLEKINISDHIVLCGWNQNAESIIDSLRNLSEKDSLHLVLVNDIHEDIVNHLRNKYKDIDLHFVAGDFTSEEILKRASIEDANTVVVVPNIDDEKIGSPDEKTIFATLTIKSISSTVRVVAYLMQRENLTHIRRANVDEVVLSDDFGAYMLASHVMDPGIPQTTKGLLNASSDERLKTNITDVSWKALDFINELRPITFNWKASQDVPTDMEQYKANENLMDTDTFDEMADKVYDLSLIHI